MMAVGCLVIETLESFRQGLANTKGKSKQLFTDFFAKESSLKPFSNVGNFYDDIRCGILHQAEVRGGWRIKRVGVLLDLENKTINAERFIQALRNAVIEYACQLQTDPELWENLKKKMEQVCANCERGSAAVPNKP